jgi:hypothetical protein
MFGRKNKGLSLPLFSHSDDCRIVQAPIVPSKSHGARSNPDIGWRPASVGSSTTASLANPPGGSIRSTQRRPGTCRSVSWPTRTIVPC